MSNKAFQPLPYPQTLESARAYFLLHGINRSEWARHFGVDQQAISDLLRGQLKGTWGQSHKTAVLLGLKRLILRRARCSGVRNHLRWGLARWRR